MNASDRPMFEPVPGLADLAPTTLALNAFVPARRFERLSVLWRIAQKTR